MTQRRARSEPQTIRSEAFSPLVLPARPSEDNGLASQPRLSPRKPGGRAACRVSSFLCVLRCFTCSNVQRADFHCFLKFESRPIS